MERPSTYSNIRHPKTRAFTSGARDLARTTQLREMHVNAGSRMNHHSFGCVRALYFASCSMVIVIVVMIVVVIGVPITFSVPLIFVTVPPGMVLAPASVAFSIQIAATILSLRTVFAMFLNRTIEPCFGFFYTMSAFIPVIVSVSVWRGGEK